MAELKFTWENADRMVRDARQALESGENYTAVADAIAEAFGEAYPRIRAEKERFFVGFTAYLFANAMREFCTVRLGEELQERSYALTVDTLGSGLCSLEDAIDGMHPVLYGLLASTDAYEGDAQGFMTAYEREHSDSFGEPYEVKAVSR